MLLQALDLLLKKKENTFSESSEKYDVINTECNGEFVFQALQSPTTTKGTVLLRKLKVVPLTWLLPEAPSCQLKWIDC